LKFFGPSPNFVAKEAAMKPSEIYRENAENCALLAGAERTKDGPAYKRYKRMEAAWQALAEEQEWLDGEVPPVRIAVVHPQKSRPSNGA
jgi:hypothetical protein